MERFRKQSKKKWIAIKSYQNAEIEKLSLDINWGRERDPNCTNKESGGPKVEKGVIRGSREYKVLVLVAGTSTLHLRGGGAW